jgi:hypothetical protein
MTESKIAELQIHKKSKLLGTLSLIAMVLSLIVFVSGCNSDTEKPKHDKMTASIMAEEFMNDRLKSPGSAEFQSYPKQQITDLGNGKYKVASYVDSQNSFGALVRTHYVCTLQYRTETDDWNLEDLQTQQQ